MSSSVETQDPETLPPRLNFFLRGISSRDLYWFALVVLFWAAGLAVSWQRWGNPLVDCGREMNLPLRLAHGEMLYSRVGFLYGPLSPYLNAGLFRTFGPSLNVLYANGIVTATLIVALIYALARVWMLPDAAAASALLLIGMCALKPGGNYIFPYSYSALHGCAAGLLTLVLAVRYVHTQRWGWLFCAGLSASVAVLAKSEFGFGALVAGLAAAVLVGYPRRQRILGGLAAFCLPAFGISILVYAAIVHRVGWYVLSWENHVFFANVPAELIYFNRWVSGLDKPLRNIFLMMGLTLHMMFLGFLIAWVSEWIEPSSSGSLGAGGASTRPATAGRRLTIAAACLIGGFVFEGSLHTAVGPFVAMPVFLFGMILLSLRAYWREMRLGSAHRSADVALLVSALFSLAMLGRVVLRVRSGGAYSAYLMPATVVLFVYLWVEALPRFLAAPSARPTARAFSMALLGMAAVTIMIVMGYRYQTYPTYRMVTPRGVMWTDADHGVAFEQAIRLIELRTAPGAAVAIMPEGTSLDFFTGRRNPLRQEMVTPGYLDDNGQQLAIRDLRDSNTRLVMIANRGTREFGPLAFGKDYDQALMGWIDQNYKLCEFIGRDVQPGMEIGDPHFFIRVYCRN